MPSTTLEQVFADFAGAVTVCDREGAILYMNRQAEQVFAAGGGAALLGCNVLDCHPEPSRTKLARMLETGETNVYTIEKNGRRKLIHQSPWYAGGELAGFIELSIVLPAGMPHFVRGGAAPQA